MPDPCPHQRCQRCTVPCAWASALALPAALALFALASCRSAPTQRTITVTSDPPGATVWLNDVEIGRTPAKASSRFYGTYDVKLELPDHQPVHEPRRARPPIHEWPGPDLLAQLSPFRLTDDVRWHFVLEPSLEQTTEPERLQTDLIDRARGLQRETRASSGAHDTESRVGPSDR